MRKILLVLASLFAVASYTYAQTEDNTTDAASTGTTIFEYDFNKFPDGPVAHSYYRLPSMSTQIFNLSKDVLNVEDPVWISLADYSSDYGLIVENSNGIHRYGLSVVDLGDAGKALCLNGASSGLSKYLNIDLPALPTHNPYHGLSFVFGNSNQSLTGKKLRVEVTYAIYQESAAEKARINSFNVRALGGGGVTIVNGNSTTTYDKLNFATKADPEDSYKANAGKLEKWVTVIHDFEVPSTSTINVNGPFYLEMQINNTGTINDKSLLVKNVKLSEIETVEHADGNVTTTDFGEVNAVASQNWNVKQKETTDGSFVVTYPHTYCNETLEYAIKKVISAEEDVKKDLNEVNDADLKYAAVKDNSEYFTIDSESGDVTVNTQAIIKKITNPTETNVRSRSVVENVVLFFQVKAGSNQVVVTKGDNNKYAINVDDNTTTGVADVIANDEVPTYYNLSGVRIANPTAPGLYIRRQGSKVTKVIVK